MTLKKIDSTLLDQVITDDSTPCVITFSKKNCHVCEEVIPRVEEFSEKLAEKLAFYYLDVEEEKGILKKFALKGVPQILFFNEGELYGKLAGNVEEDEIEEKIDELIQG